MVTAAGTVTALLLLANVTLTPVEGAAELSDTVHVVVPAPVNEPLPHVRALTEGAEGEEGPLRLIEVVFLIVPCAAVSVTVCAELTADTLAAKLALDAPEGTETEVGTTTTVLLLAILTDMPLFPAGALNFTVHVSEPAVVIDEFVQLSAAREGEEAPLPCSFTVPPRLREEPDLASTLSWPVESVVEPGSYRT